MATALLMLLLLLAAAVSAEVKPAALQPACPAVGGGSKTAAQRLHHALFCSYDPSVMPLADVTKNMHVHLSAWLQSITVNEYYHDTLVVNIWILMTWKDDYLAWDPSVYEGISELRPPVEKIWKPKFVVNEPRYGPWLTQHGPTEVCALSHDGSVECMWPASFSLPCLLQYQGWPFDTQTCMFSLMAISDNDTMLSLTLDKTTQMLTMFMLANPEWELVDAHVEASEVASLLGPAGSRTPSLSFRLQLARRAAVYVAAVVLPALGGVLMALLPYLLKPSLAHRSLLAAAGVVAHLFELQLLSSMLYGPSGVSVPPVVLLYRDSLVLCSLSLLVSVIHRWLLVSSPDPPLALKDASSRLLDFWARNLSFVRLQPQKAPAAPDSPVADFWLRWTNAADGLLLALSLAAYVILLIRFLP